MATRWKMLPIIRRLVGAPALPAHAQAVGAEKARLQALLSSLHEPIVTTTPQGEITSCNEAARSLFSSANGVIGRPIHELLPLITAQGTTARPDSWSGTLVDASGRSRQLEISRTRLAEGSLPALDVYVVHDAVDYAAMSRLREELLHNVAHELRGTMTVLENAVDIITTDYGELTTAELDRLNRSVRHTAHRLHALMENLLSAGSIQAGRFQVNPAPVALAPIVDDAIEMLTGLIEGRGQRLETRIPADCVVLADGQYLRQVLQNLLSNASKYSPDGERIDVRAEPSNGQVRVTVQDYGPGIPPEQQQGLFERFYRVRPGNSEPGIGLGLAICKGIIDAHGGTMGIESAPGIGTSVWFTVPTAARETQ